MREPTTTVMTLETFRDPASALALARKVGLVLDDRDRAIDAPKPRRATKAGR